MHLHTTENKLRYINEIMLETRSGAIDISRSLISMQQPPIPPISISLTPILSPPIALPHIAYQYT